MASPPYLLEAARNAINRRLVREQGDEQSRQQDQNRAVQVMGLAQPFALQQMKPSQDDMLDQIREKGLAVIRRAELEKEGRIGAADVGGGYRVKAAEAGAAPRMAAVQHDVDWDPQAEAGEMDRARMTDQRMRDIAVGHETAATGRANIGAKALVDASGRPQRPPSPVEQKTAAEKQEDAARALWVKALGDEVGALDDAEAAIKRKATAAARAGLLNVYRRNHDGATPPADYWIGAMKEGGIDVAPGGGRLGSNR